MVAGTVLLIEDEPNIIEAISFLLKQDGWSVATHSDGKTAVDIISKTLPDVLILDVMLPNKSGHAILQELRQDPATKALPIMMLTAKGQAKDQDAALANGADVYMTKPFSNQALVDTVRRLAAQ